jgi:hypothetical protein
MKLLLRLLVVCGAFCAVLFATPPPAVAHDVDGPDCQITRQDYGDAPEDVLAYPGVIGKFPTCSAIGLPSTFDISCPPISTPPGPSGFVEHLLFGDNYWLGCWGLAGIGPMGVDTDFDGKTNQPAVGFSHCGPVPGFPTDCVEAAFGLTFDQDECYADGSDAGVKPPSLVVCETSTVSFDTFSCGPQPHQAFLNILIDMNQDGDWNDNFACPQGCAYEWAVKNEPIVILPGCVPHVSPAFLVGPKPGHGWMRVTICDELVSVDFPWSGSVSQGGLHNGETEDYPVDIQIRTPALPSTWGHIKSLYRS